MQLTFILETLIILGFSILIIYLCQRIRIPTVVGLLLTGIIIGPTGLGLIQASSTIDVFAEIGIAMLLFTIGLEFSLSELSRIRTFFLIGGTLQLLCTTLISVVLFRFLHFQTGPSLFYGFLLSLSSTAVVLKLYSDFSMTHSLSGKISLGILLFQDFAVVPMIIAAPFLGSISGQAAPFLWGKFFIDMGLVTVSIAILFLLIPRLLHLLIRSRIRELFVMTALFLCLGLAYLTYRSGFSLALGAFLAGLLIARSEYHLQFSTEIMSFKGLFSSLFFISIGLLSDLSFAWKHLPLITGIALSIMALKTGIVFSVVRLLKFPFSIAATVGVGLCQVGEFSFLLAKIGQTYGLMGGETFPLFISSAILTMAASPFLILHSPRWLKKFIGKKSGMVGSIKQEAPAGLNRHVIVAGYGLNGRNLVRVLRETGIPFIVLELNPDTVKECQKQNLPVLFGDASSPEVLSAAALSKAHVLVLAISDPRQSLLSVKIAKQHNPAIYIIVRTRYINEIDPLYRAGADQVIPEEFETSIEIFTHTLSRYHLPRNIIETQIQVIRSERYGMLRGEPGNLETKERVSRYLNMGTAETFLIQPESPAAGKTLWELDLRNQTGATIIAVVRNERSYTSPAGDFAIEEGDILVLAANHRDMDRAFVFLSGEKNP